jgi:hypothetical protein
LAAQTIKTGVAGTARRCARSMRAHGGKTNVESEQVKERHFFHAGT